MRRSSSGLRRFKSPLGVGLLMGLVTLFVCGVSSASSAADLYFLPLYATTNTLAQQEQASVLKVYHIPLRVHLNGSSRRVSDFFKILEEINHIWWSQAGICFDMQVVMDDNVLSSGFDLWFVPLIYGNDFINGVFNSRHSIYVRDTPVLNPAPNPAQHSAARTAAHELGHALNLPHRQESDDNLMRSKTYGWKLNREEIAIARKSAAARAIKNNTAPCKTVQINP
jgi:hypothetical protein